MLLLWFRHFLLSRILPDNLGSQVIFCEFTGESLQEIVFFIRRFLLALQVAGSCFPYNLLLPWLTSMKWTFILRDLWLKLWDAEIVKLGGMFYVTLPVM